MPVVTLTSDFGPGPFAGLMKGVILSICPAARLVDLSHQVPPQDVRAGALVLEQALGVFPPGTVHLAVVDPGVGTARRPLCVQAGGQFWVGPDNGLFTPVLLAHPDARAFLLQEERFFRQPVSATFHGRDIFAPVAARLACGLDPRELGPEVSDPVRLEWPRPRVEGGVLLGAILGADAFGNLGSNLPRPLVEEFLAGDEAVVRLRELEVRGIRRAYGQVPPGQVLALFDSLDRLELARNQGNLCAHLGLDPRRVFGLEVQVLRRRR